METTIEDDRTPEQRARLTIGVCMTDSFMSGWGLAKGRPSYAVWACHYDHVGAVERWVRSRTDARRVRIVDLRTYRPRGAHCHIYDVEPGHPALPVWMVQP